MNFPILSSLILLPTIGSKIKDDKIGKFIILQLKKLKKQKNLLALRMHTDK